MCKKIIQHYLIVFDSIDGNSVFVFFFASTNSSPNRLPSKALLTSWTAPNGLVMGGSGHALRSAHQSRATATTATTLSASCTFRTAHHHRDPMHSRHTMRMENADEQNGFLKGNIYNCQCQPMVEHDAIVANRSIDDQEDDGRDAMHMQPQTISRW